MSLQPLLEKLATSIELCSVEDGEALSGILQEIRALKESWSAPPTELERALDHALGLAEALVASSSADPDEDLAGIEAFVREATRALVPPEETGEIVDDELLRMFLTGCEEAVAKIEACLIELETHPERNEVLEEARGVIHTLKGECGVIPLPEAQLVFHEAESLVHRCTVKGDPLPVDALLEALDWFKSFAEELNESPTSLPPPYEMILAKLQGRKDVAQDEEAISDERICFPDEVMTDPTLSDFVSEARSHLEDAEAALLEVEQSPDDLELINRIFRTFHTIKGVAGFMNMGGMVELAHSTEALLDAFRQDKLVCNEQHTTLIFACCDMMSSMLDYLLGGEPPRKAEVQHLVAQTTRAARDEAFDCRALGAEDRHRPSGPSGPPATATPKAPEQNERASEASAPAVAPAAPATRTVAAALPEPVQAAEPEAAAAPMAEAAGEEAARPGSGNKKKYRLDNTVKVATQRLDLLVDMVGELVIAQQMVSQDPALEGLNSQRLARNLSQVAKITRDLQESAMSLRMVTLKSTFQKMSRLARDVAHKSGKNVHLVVTGEDIELDRTVVEEISDPLVHLLRNSIDHGLEMPDERSRAGKPERGIVELRAYHQGGSIVIEISDDGRGLNRSKILAKAMERGIVPADTRSEDVPDTEIFRLIFQPGFSTADKVTDISGRGVGMDVVRRNIEKMRGKIDISSTQGRGTSFYLRLPLTLAIIDGMIVRVGQRRYVIPTLAIEMSFRPTRSQLHTLMHKGELVDVRGMLLPIHRLRGLFALDEGASDIEQGILILIEDNGQRVCLLVDEILGQQQVVIKNLGKALPPTPCIAGGAILGDGRVALIVDIDAILTEVHQPTA